MSGRCAYKDRLKCYYFGRQRKRQRTGKILSVQAGNIVIGVPQELIGKTLTVMTMYGAEVMHQNVTSASVTLDTNLLGKGMYIVRIGSKALKVSL